MTCTVYIEDVEFSTNNGIWAFGIDLTALLAFSRWKEIAHVIAADTGRNPDELISWLEDALDFWKHPMLADACCGGMGPLANAGRIHIDTFLSVIYAEEQRRKDREAKRSLTKTRRGEFNAARPHLALALLNAGHSYRCADPACLVTTDLTIDHIVPLSRGGTDDLENLRFLCRSHNSAKGDR